MIVANASEIQAGMVIARRPNSPHTYTVANVWHRPGLTLVTLWPKSFDGPMTRWELLPDSPVVVLATPTTTKVA